MPQMPAVRRRTVLAAGGAVALAACTASDEPAPPSPSPSPSGRAMPSTRRPTYHLTPPSHWMNDPQRPVFSDGQWHLYYLYNADFPHGNGTAWARAVSADMVTWQHEGVAKIGRAHV